MTSPTGNLAWQELTLAEQQSTQPQRKTASRKQKAIAACTGAVVTSLLMTPFDVIKTRLQTQPSAEPLFVPSSHIPRTPRIGEPSSSRVKLPAVSHSHSATCCQQTFFTGNSHESGLTCKYDPRLAAETTGAGVARGTHYPPLSTSGSRTRAHHPRASFAPTTSYVSPPSGNSSAALRLHPSSTCAYPSQSVAVVELEALTRQSRVTGIWDGVVKVSRAEGARGLWRGLSPTLLMTIPSQVTYMTCYDHFRAFFLALGASASDQKTPSSSSSSNITGHTLFASLASGALSRSVSATLVTPLELVRTRLQASDVSHSLTSIVTSLSSQVKSEGPSVLFRGLSTTLWRDVPFSAIYFMGYETLKRVMTGGSGLGEGQGQGGLEEFVVAFVSGATSGSVAALATHPFDLVKTRLQASTGAMSSPRARAGAASASADGSAGTAAKRASGSHTLGALRAILRDEGWQGMFRGLSPRIAKVAPACGLMIGSYEAVGTLFAIAQSD
ncbi:unnamed protein product [Parajaminaea phylloscopi]